MESCLLREISHTEKGSRQWLLILTTDVMISNTENLQQVAQVCTGWTTFAILFSGFLGATVATIAIYMSRKTAREKNAADVLQMAQRDRTLADGIRVVQEIYKNGAMESFAHEENRLTTEATLTRYVLNFYEDIAVGINRNIYSETFIKEASYTTIVDLCDRTRPFMEHMRIRKKQKTAWKELESLGKRWREKPIL